MKQYSAKHNASLAKHHEYFPISQLLVKLRRTESRVLVANEGPTTNGWFLLQHFVATPRGRVVFWTSESLFRNLHDKDERVCVVSVIGKSKLNFHHSKATMINQLLLSDAFTVRYYSDAFQSIEQKTKGKEGTFGFLGLLALQGNIPEGAARCSVETPSLVEAFYDSKEHVIYLHLQSECDTCQLVQLCQKAAQHISSVVREIIRFVEFTKRMFLVLLLVRTFFMLHFRGRIRFGSRQNFTMRGCSCSSFPSPTLCWCVQSANYLFPPD